MSLRGAKRLRGNAEANSEIPHFVRNKLSNPMKSNTYEIRDCFAPLAMTTLRVFTRPSHLILFFEVIAKLFQICSPAWGRGPIGIFAIGPFLKKI